MNLKAESRECFASAASAGRGKLVLKVFFCLFNIQNKPFSACPLRAGSLPARHRHRWDGGELHSELQLPCPAEAGGTGGVPQGARGQCRGPACCGVSFSLSELSGGKLLPFDTGDPQEGAGMVPVLRGGLYPDGDVPL